MTHSRVDLASIALERSLEVRDEFGYDYRSPLCPYELAERAGVRVRFVDDVSMEGVYAALQQPTILISSLRPMTRRGYTCAHELGHHFFAHGSTVDELRDDAGQARFQPNEFLAEAFAGFLLMPAQGIRRAFALRNLTPASATAESFYAVSSCFGVGYTTLIGHVAFSLKQLSRARASELTSLKLPQIRKSLLGYLTREPLAVVDQNHLSGTVDVEVGTLVLLPCGAESENGHLRIEKEVPAGRLFRAHRAGLARVSVPDREWGVIVRISRFQYSGLARYRHLEDDDDV